MSAVSFEEMEAKRLQVSRPGVAASRACVCPKRQPTNPQMIGTFNELANVMRRCVALIDDYTNTTPSTLAAASSHADIVKALGAVEEKKVGRPKKEKKIKDPNAPKRPPSAYILYQNEVRDEIRKAHPEMPYKDVLALISTRWKALPDAQRKVGRVSRCHAYATATYTRSSTRLTRMPRRSSRRSRTRTSRAWCVKHTYNHAIDSDSSQNEPSVLAPAVAEASSDSSSDSDSDSSSDGAVSVPMHPTNPSLTQTPPPAPAPAPVYTPTVPAVKEKKRKSKDEAPSSTVKATDGEKKVSEV